MNYETTKVRLWSEDVAVITGLENGGTFTLRALCDAILAHPELSAEVEWGWDLIGHTLSRSGPKGSSVGWTQVVAEEVQE